MSLLVTENWIAEDWIDTKPNFTLQVGNGTLK